MFKFYYYIDLDEIRVYKDDLNYTTISTGMKQITNEEVLKLSQDWLDDRNINNIPYKVYVELH